MYISYLLCSFICWWTLKLFPYLDNCKYCWYEHWSAYILSISVFCFFLIYAQERNCWVIWWFLSAAAPDLGALLLFPWSSGCYANSYPLSQWCHPTISSSVILFSCPQSFPTSGSFQMSQLFTSGGQSIGVSASTSVLPMNIQDWFPLGLTGCISLQSKGLSRVFSNTTFQKHQFFSSQLSLWSNSHVHTWLLKKVPVGDT